MSPPTEAHRRRARLLQQLACVGVALFALAAGLSGCGTPQSNEQRSEPTPASAPMGPTADQCPATATVATIPGTRPEHLRLDYWTQQLGKAADLDEVLLTPEQIANHNRGIAQADLGYVDIAEPMGQAEVREQVNSRLSWLHDKLADQSYVDKTGAAVTGESLAAFEPPPTLPALRNELRLATGAIPIRCGPRQEGFYKPDLNLAFDRNNCSTVRAQEPLQVVADWPGPMQLVRTRYSIGWIPDDAPLSPVAPAGLRAALVHGDGFTAHTPLSLSVGAERVEVPAGAVLAAVPGQPDGVFVATSKTIGKAKLPAVGATAGDAACTTRRPMTRRAVLEEAFALLGQPYGWGGQDGGRDCSRLLMDIFGGFGLDLPRFSGHQAATGTFSVDISKVPTDRERMSIIDAAARKGMVLLYFPGHIMLYLGRDADGTPMALHAFAEYLVPCDGKAPAGDEPRETLLTNKDVTVTTLELGRGSSRTAFIERITHIAVLGQAPGVELDGIAELRPAAPIDPPADCSSNGWGEDKTTVVISPRSPNADQPLRVIVTAYQPRGPGQLVLFDPSGKKIVPELVRTGGPPYGWIATLPPPKTGTWMAAFGDGDDVRACKKFKVVAHGTRFGRCNKDEATGDDVDPVWTPSQSWGPRTESLYATFIERLFDYPTDQELTWTNLSQLLTDPDRNILHDHFSRDEEKRIRLQPDCADLPYFLRAYFAWKMGLPFGFRHCNRGIAGEPPRCSELMSNGMACEGNSYVEAFSEFVRRHVGGGVHSGHGRTAPDYDYTDYYPVPLTREHLRPGTIFADPYGHVMIIIRWIPQTTEDYGILLAADAQPDSTISRRRFWRGTFLFTPDLDAGGAGFKAFRPVRWDRDKKEAIAFTNDLLVNSQSFAPISSQQYEGTADDFYDRMTQLINPRPLDPVAVQRSLIDGFAEQLVGRVLSVDNGVNYVRDHKGLIEMPDGDEIFLTTGPWEDYSTPSRDMRLLIALDTVVKFPDAVARNPEQYGLTRDADLPARIDELRKVLDKELRARTFAYHRSDGAEQTLTLQDIVDRQQSFEVAYNPNDCPEVRWGAPEGSAELRSCTRHAPEAQRKKMLEYRAWFRKRERPS